MKTRLRMSNIQHEKKVNRSPEVKGRKLCLLEHNDGLRDRLDGMT